MIRNQMTLTKMKKVVNPEEEVSRSTSKVKEDGNPRLPIYPLTNATIP